MKKLGKVKQKRFEFKHGQKPKMSVDFSEEKLKADILAEAKKLHVAVSTAEMIAEKVVTNVSKWVTKRTTVTLDDINRRVALEIAKYNVDLSYVYQNRGKII